MWLKYPHRYNPKSPYYVEQSDFFKINYEFNKRLAEYILDGNSYKLPAKGGHLRIKKFKPKFKVAVDYKKTEEVFGKDIWEKNKNLPKDQVKVIYHKNRHSEGWSARWWWEPTRYWKWRFLYKFVPVRKNARALTRNIKDGNNIIKYLE